MFQAIFVISILSLLIISMAEPPVPQYGVPFGSNPPINSYGTPNYNNDQQGHDHSEPKSYEFGYQVKDDYTGNNYGRQERSDGNQVTGEYRVQLPDGRTQIVTYYADWQTGYHADVRYEGQAQYPDNNIYNNPNQYGPPGSNQGPPGSNQYGPPTAPGVTQYGPPGSNQYGPPGSNQYGRPTAPGVNQYGPPNPAGGQRVSIGQYRDNQNYDYNAPARSSVAIKGLSGGSGPYRGRDDYNRGVNDGINFESNFGSRVRPGPVYGAP